MPWTSLAERIDTLPLVIAGPIVRRTEPGTVTIWLALKAARMVTLRIYARNDAGQLLVRFEGSAPTIRLGDYLHLVSVTAQTEHEQQRLDWGELYYYDLFFTEHLPAQNQKPVLTDLAEHLATPGVLSTDPNESNPLQRITYANHPLPSFMLPARDVSQLRIIHGSCRKPHGVGRETLSAVDTLLSKYSQDTQQRPQQLYMTGDQIYADDVAAPLLLTLIDASRILFAGKQTELLPIVNSPADKIGPITRKDLVCKQAQLTTAKAYNHLLSFAEYSAMYLFVWSDVLWQDNLPSVEDMWEYYPESKPGQTGIEQHISTYEAELVHLRGFRSTLPLVRRALANIATYMVCDDHDVTDDWYLDGAWCKNVHKNPLGNRIVRNGLLAYALFQAWGNTPQQFASPAGKTFLTTIDSWHGSELDARTHSIAQLIGMPAPFNGKGTLQRSQQALHWHYTYDGPNYQFIVMDTRTQRQYLAPGDFPGLLSPQAMQKQILDVARKEAEVSILISPTPVMGVDFIETVQLWSRWRIEENYDYDREAWALEWGTFQRFLRTISGLKRIVFLSGDVHYAFGSSMQYWDRHTQQTAKMVNLTSSPFCNEGSGSQISVLAVGYPRIQRMLRRRGPDATLDFFVWDILGDDSHTLNYILTKIRQRLHRFWWSVPRLMSAHRSQHEIVLPAWGWLKGTFDTLPPDRSYRLNYLHNNLVRQDKGDPRPHRKLAKLILKPLRTALNSVTLVQSIAKRFRLKLTDTTTKLDQKQPKLLQKPTQSIVGEVIEETEDFETDLEKPKQKILDTILHYETWLSRWKAGKLIVGYNNIGEISFSWQPTQKEVIQRLWWYSPDVTTQLQSTEYRDTLELPQFEDEPPLP